jgi:2-hydroxychromene-2-carboxylate isomerase
MGEIISLDVWRAQHRELISTRLPTFFFDLACPFSYLTAEQVERTLGPVRWSPVSLPTRAGHGPSVASVRERAEARARGLRLPLVWPDSFPGPAPCALRAAAYAVSFGVGSAFALAASRLAFCGGFDLDDPETLAEAAGASGLPFEDCLRAAVDPAWDEPLHRTAEVLRRAGVRELPAFCVEGRWLQGESALLAAAYLQHRSPDSGRPLAPVV